MERYQWRAAPALPQVLWTKILVMFWHKPPEPKWLYHCKPCLVTWIGPDQKCWHCGEPGEQGAIPPGFAPGWSSVSEVRFDREET